jgi:hypothetical protein
MFEIASKPFLKFLGNSAQNLAISSKELSIDSTIGIYTVLRTVLKSYPRGEKMLINSSGRNETSSCWQ